MVITPAFIALVLSMLSQENGAYFTETLHRYEFVEDYVTFIKNFDNGYE